MADLSPPLNEDEIVSLLRFHVRAELALIEAGTATKETCSRMFSVSSSCTCCCPMSA
jgi:hypothetical protein